MRLPVKVFSTFTFGKNAEEVEETKMIKAVVSDGTKIRVGAGITLSKNYQSVRVDVQVEYPATKKTASSVADEAWELAEAELGRKMSEARKLLAKLG